jgi:hypothetical protein
MCNQRNNCSETDLHADVKFVYIWAGVFLTILVGVVIAALVSGCAAFAKFQPMISDACVPACGEVQKITEEQCSDVCDKVLMFDSGIQEFAEICNLSCVFAVITGEDKCVDACKMGVDEAVKVAESF